MSLTIMILVLCFVISLVTLLGLWLLEPFKPKLPEKLLRGSVISAEEAVNIWDRKVEQNCPATGKRYLIVGSGFVGSRIVWSLLRRGEKHITVFDITPQKQWHQNPSVHYIQGDIRNLQHLLPATLNQHTVFCTAALIRYPDHFQFQLPKSFNINVTGTKNLIQACKQNNVQHLILTSTSHVCLRKGQLGKKSVWDESDVYVDGASAVSVYGYTKALGEEVALMGHERGGLEVVVVRPASGVFGKEDRFLVEEVVRSGRYVMIGENYCDWVYVDNLVYGHLLAEAFLIKGPKDKPEIFNISNDEPISCPHFVALVKHFFPTLEVQCAPWRLVYLISFALDILRYVLRDKCPSFGQLDYLSLSTWKIVNANYVFNCQKAKNMLGYAPLFSVTQGVALSLEETIKNFNFYELKKQ